MKLFIASRASVVIGAALMLWITLPPGAHGAVKEQGGGTDLSSTCEVCGRNGTVMHVYDHKLDYYNVADMCFQKNTTSEYPTLYGYICLKGNDPKSNDLIKDKNYKALEDFTCDDDTVPLKVENASLDGSMLTIEIRTDGGLFDGELSCGGNIKTTAFCGGEIKVNSDEFYHFQNLEVSNTCLTSII